MTDEEDSGTIGRVTPPARGRRVHEHRRARASVSPRAASAGGTDGLGMAAVSALRGDGDLQVGELRATAVVPERAADGAGAAASVCGVWTDVFGGVGAAGAGRVVRAGGAAERARPLAAPGDLDTADGGGGAGVAGGPRTGGAGGGP